jgi:hypothetical protein
VSSLSPKAALVYTTLLRHAGADVARIEGLAWAAVRLDAVRLDSMSAHAFAGCLRALERAGLYRSNYDDAYGLVRLPSDASVI